MSKVKIKKLDSVTSNDTTATETINANFEAIQEELENTLSRNGKTPNYMDAELDMNSRRIINVAEAVDDLDVVNKKYVDTRVEEAKVYAEEAKLSAARAANSAEGAKLSADAALIAAANAQASEQSAAASAQEAKDTLEEVKEEATTAITNIQTKADEATTGITDLTTSSIKSIQDQTAESTKAITDLTDESLKEISDAIAGLDTDSGSSVAKLYFKEIKSITTSSEKAVAIFWNAPSDSSITALEEGKIYALWVSGPIDPILGGREDYPIKIKVDDSTYAPVHGRDYAGTLTYQQFWKYYYGKNVSDEYQYYVVPFLYLEGKAIILASKIIEEEDTSKNPRTIYCDLSADIAVDEDNKKVTLGFKDEKGKVFRTADLGETYYLRFTNVEALTNYADYLPMFGNFYISGSDPVSDFDTTFCSLDNKKIETCKELMQYFGELQNSRVTRNSEGTATISTSVVDSYYLVPCLYTMDCSCMLLRELPASQVAYDNIGRVIQLSFNGVLEDNVITFTPTEGEAYDIRQGYEYEIDLLLEAVGDIDNPSMIILNGTKACTILNAIHTDPSMLLSVQDLAQVQEYDVDTGFRWIFRAKYVELESGFKVFYMERPVARIVTEVNAMSSDAECPSAKLFYDTIGDVEELINAL